MALCSECKKNAAVVFINKIVDGKPNLEGLCLACAKKRGINPLASMMKQYGASDEEIENMNSQFDEIVESMQDIELDPESLNMDGMSDMGESEGNRENPVNAISNMFNDLLRNMGTKNSSSGATAGNIDNKKDVEGTKKDNKKADKKKKYLDTYGINLTQRAKEGKIYKLIGR